MLEIPKIFIAGGQVMKRISVGLVLLLSLLGTAHGAYYECKFRDIESHLAENIGVGSGLGAAKCVGTNGRSYILLISKESFNLGYINSLFSEGEEIKTSNKFISLEEDKSHQLQASFLNELFDDEAELSLIGTSSGSGNTSSLGGHQAHKAIQITNKFDSLAGIN
jgi:hypothetical protein